MKSDLGGMSFKRIWQYFHVGCGGKSKVKKNLWDSFLALATSKDRIATKWSEEDWEEQGIGNWKFNFFKMLILIFLLDIQMKKVSNKRLDRLIKRRDLGCRYISDLLAYTSI